MPRTKTPHKGSLQVWPRVRAKRAYARVRTWHAGKDAKPLGFAGYKAGMTHIMTIDNKSTSHTKGATIAVPVTIIECPPIKVVGIRCYNTKNNVIILSWMLDGYIGHVGVLEKITKNHIYIADPHTGTTKKIQTASLKKSTNYAIVSPYHSSVVSEFA